MHKSSAKTFIHAFFCCRISVGYTLIVLMFLIVIPLMKCLEHNSKRGVVLTVKIREMRDADIQKVQEIAKVSWHDTYEGIIPLNIQDNFLEFAYNDAQMKRRLEQSVIYVAEVEGQVVGFANYSQISKEGKVELSAIYLHPNSQGVGIGTALLKEAAVNLQGLKEIYINVEKENQIGLNFYEAKGFEIIDEFDDDFDGHILKTIRMVWKVK